MKKALMTAHMAYAIWQYNLDNLRLLISLGYETHVAANFDATESRNITSERVFQIRHDLESMGVIVHDIPFTRSPFTIKNITAYFALSRLLRRGRFSLIHTQTPVGGALTRLAANKYRAKGTRVIYTAHGFHFFKGAPVINWLIYYPVERWLSRFTDEIIVINNEDERIARSFCTARVTKIPGVGVALERFLSIPTPSKGFTLGYIAEINRNKNQIMLIHIINKVLSFAPDARLILIGSDTLAGELQALASSLGVSNAISFVGFCTDVHIALADIDIVVAPSYREGLPVNIIEAMAAARPVVASDIRGHRDLVINNETGFLFPPGDENALIACLRHLYKNVDLRSSMGMYARLQSYRYGTFAVQPFMRDIYAGVCGHLSVKP